MNHNQHGLHQSTRKYLRLTIITMFIYGILHVTRVPLLFTQYSAVQLNELKHASYFEQIVRDWAQPPITAIWLTANKKECAEPAFTRRWHGIQSYMYGKKKKKKGRPSFGPIGGRSGSQFANGMYICLRRAHTAASALLSMSEDPLQGVTCADGKVACSQALMTMCVDPERVDQDCPLTDVKLIKKQDYDPNFFQEYAIADGAVGLEWQLLYSRSVPNLPLTKFALSEELPCQTDGTFQVTSNPGKENIGGRTRDPYRGSCPNSFDAYLEPTFRPSGDSVTVNEFEWLDKLGVVNIIKHLPETNEAPYFDAKKQNELRLWHGRISEWAPECDPLDSSVRTMSEMLATKRSNKADRVGFERTFEGIHGAWIAYASFLSVQFLGIFFFIDAKELKKNNTFILKCNRVFGIAFTLICLMSCITQTVLEGMIASCNYYDLDRNAFLAGIDQFYRCSGPGLDEVIRSQREPEYIDQYGGSQAGRIACLVIGWLQLLIILVHFYASGKTIQAQQDANVRVEVDLARLEQQKKKEEEKKNETANKAAVSTDSQLTELQQKLKKMEEMKKIERAKPRHIEEVKAEEPNPQQLLGAAVSSEHAKASVLQLVNKNKKATRIKIADHAQPQERQFAPPAVGPDAHLGVAAPPSMTKSNSKAKLRLLEHIDKNRDYDDSKAGLLPVTGPENRGAAVETDRDFDTMPPIAGFDRAMSMNQPQNLT